jgi:hypothetical protein
MVPDNRTHLKNVFWSHIFVGASFQILDNQQVACGFKLGPAAILNQNPIFAMGSRQSAVVKQFDRSTTAMFPITAGHGRFFSEYWFFTKS